MSGLQRVPLSLPRHAANPRGVGRAGEVWRLFQEAAVVASARAGWPAERYARAGTAFVVYGMTVRHQREIPYGEPLEAETWVREFRRGVLSEREVRLQGPRGRVAEGTQRWVHVSAALKPTRAPAELLAAFAALDRPDEPAVTLPAFEPREGPEARFAFEVWHTWMDPLGHVNHPAYVDFCDEATSRALARAGVDPVRLVPVAEQVDWKRGALAGARLQVRSRLIGRSAEGQAVISHQIVDAQDEGQLYASATTVRGLLDGPEGELLRVLEDLGGGP